MALAKIISRITRKATKKSISKKPTAKSVKQKSREIDKKRPKIKTEQLRKQFVKKKTTAPKKETLGSLRKNLNKAKNYKEYSRIQKKITELEDLKAQRKFNSHSSLFKFWFAHCINF